jgi:hypothetical protein
VIAVVLVVLALAAVVVVLVVWRRCRKKELVPDRLKERLLNMDQMTGSAAEHQGRSNAQENWHECVLSPFRSPIRFSLLPASPSPSTLRSLSLSPDVKLKLLGAGAYGEAYKCIHPQKTQRFVVKRIRKPNTEEAAEGIPDWETELHNMKAVQSDFIVSLIEHWDDVFCGYIVMEYCDGGNLRKAMQARLSTGGSFSEEVWLLPVFVSFSAVSVPLSLSLSFPSISLSLRPSLFPLLFTLHLVCFRRSGASLHKL